MTVLAGYYQFPKQAAKQPACLELSSIAAEMILVLNNREKQPYLLAELSISASLSNIPHTITFPDGGRFVPTDNSQFVNWLTQHQPVSWLQKLENSKKGIIATLLCSVLAIFFFFRVLLPQGSELIASQLPDAVSVLVGQGTLDVLDEQGFSASKLPVERQQALQALFKQAQPDVIRQHTLPVSLKFRRASLNEANAFTLADGSIVMTDSLVKMSKNDDELVAVMLHEMGHHYYLHVMQMVVSSSIILVTSAWVIGDAGGVSDSLINSGAVVITLGYSRDMERDADAFAIKEMQKQQRPLSAMRAIYSRLGHENVDDNQSVRSKWSLWSLFATHPDMQERLATIEAAALIQKQRAEVEH